MNFHDDPFGAKMLKKKQKQKQNKTQPLPPPKKKKTSTLTTKHEPLKASYGLFVISVIRAIVRLSCDFIVRFQWAHDISFLS